VPVRKGVMPIHLLETSNACVAKNTMYGIKSLRGPKERTPSTPDVTRLDASGAARQVPSPDLTGSGAHVGTDLMGIAVGMIGLKLLAIDSLQSFVVSCNLHGSWFEISVQP